MRVVHKSKLSSSLNAGLQKFVHLLLITFLIDLFPTNCIVQETDRHKRIVNGTEVHLAEFPFEVYIDCEGKQCTGALLNDHVLLTAAHCFINVKSCLLKVAHFTQNWRPRDFFDPRIAQRSVTFFPHPCFSINDNNTLRYDVGLIVLPERLKPSIYIGFVTLPPYEDIITTLHYDQVLTTIGWGYGTKTAQTKILLYGDMKVQRQNVCEPFHEMFQDYMLICAVGSQQAMCGPGDYGAPLFYKRGHGKNATFVQLGVNTFLVGKWLKGEQLCENAKIPQGFVRLGPHVKWIQYMLREKTQEKNWTNAGRPTTYKPPVCIPFKFIPKRTTQHSTTVTDSSSSPTSSLLTSPSTAIEDIRVTALYYSQAEKHCCFRCIILLIATVVIFLNESLA